MTDQLESRLRDFAEAIVSGSPTPPDFDTLEFDDSFGESRGASANALRGLLLAGVAAALLVGVLAWVRSGVDDEGPVARLPDVMLPSTDGCGNDLSGLRSSVVALNVSDGSEVWRIDTPVVAAGAATVHDREIVLQALPTGVIVVDPRSGAATAKADSPDATPAPVAPEASATYGGFTLSRGGPENVWTAVDSTTGVEAWRWEPVRQGGTSNPLPLDDYVIFVESDQTPTCI